MKGQKPESGARALTAAAAPEILGFALPEACVAGVDAALAALEDHVAKLDGWVKPEDGVA